MGETPDLGISGMELTGAGANLESEMKRIKELD